jgi:periplasmic protein CpxP/Spy
MKKIFAILAITFMSQLVFAQAKEATATEFNKTKKENNGFHKKGKHRKAEMMKQLNLSEEQKAKLSEMKAVNKQKREAIKNNSSLTEDQKKEQLKALKGENKKSMQGMLTEEQKQKMKEMKAKMKDEKKKHKKMKGSKADNETTKEEVKTETSN